MKINYQNVTGQDIINANHERPPRTSSNPPDLQNLISKVHSVILAKRTKSDDSANDSTEQQIQPPKQVISINESSDNNKSQIQINQSRNHRNNWRTRVIW